MTFLAPVWIGLAGVASLAVVAIHFIAWRMPRAARLPTARFVPDEPARLAARTLRLADLPLLALRVACLMVAGLAMAKPVLRPSPQGSVTIVAMERATADVGELRDSLRAIPRADRTRFVVFDTVAQVHEDEDAALTDAGSPGVGNGVSLSVGLLAAIREARRLAREHESVGIVLASTFSRSSFDRATSEVRATWRDSIRLVRLEPPARVVPPAIVETRGASDDPVVAGVRLAESNRLLQGTSRVVRDVVTASDSGWIRSGRALIVWPRARSADPERVDAIHGGGFTTIGHFILLRPSALSAQRSALATATVIARWMDGTTAARQTAHAGGCLRTIGFDVPSTGDLVLTPAFQRLVSVLVAPCEGLQETSVASDSAIASIATAPGATPTLTLPDESGDGNRLAAGLMAFAILLALVELLLRRRLANRAQLRPAEQGA